MPATVASLYEQLFPLTTVMKQRVVENFSGDAPDVDRWGFGNQDGTTGNLASMADSVDGGLKLTCGTSAGGQSLWMSFMTGTSLTGSDNGTVTTIPFKPYSSTGAVMISVWKITSICSRC